MYCVGLYAIELALAENGGVAFEIFLLSSNWYTTRVMSTSGFTTAILNLRLNGASWDVGDSTTEPGMSKNMGIDTRIVLLSGRILEL